MEHNQVEYEIPVDLAPGIVNNTKSSYKFKFDGIFDMTSRQDDVFSRVAKEACDNALSGYNATIFAYGQTGSGKTFTITGGPERYEDRGIIPRAMSYLYSEFKKRSDQQFSAYVSYLEIYNEAGYDLLDPSHETKSLEELPRVTLMEDDAGNVHLKNLSLHHATNEEDALNMLFTGDTNRAISETPMNMASSRSHCIFTISIESRVLGSDTVRRSKLHLVDLAGSERVHKTHATGQLLREAAHINKSLHFLELVIKTLAEKKSDVYIPYRNSMMTSVLRDSLGGNCKTVMIATFNPEEEQLGESISTCRFSQRVAAVKNSAIVNEETDPMLIIRRLRTEVAALKSEIAFLKGEQGEETSLSEDDEASLLSAVKLWVQAGEEGPLDIGAFTSTRIHAAFRMLRRLAKEGGGGGGGGPQASTATGSSGPSAPAASSTPARPVEVPARDDHALGLEIKQLRAQLQQRDNEIAILVNMVKDLKERLGGGGGPGPAAAVPLSASVSFSSGSSYPPGTPVSTLPSPSAGLGSVGAMLAMGDVIDPAILADRDKAMDVFMASYPKAQAINDNKELLKSKYAQAKALAERVNGARDGINRLKKAIEVRRMERAVQSVAELKDADSETVASAVASMPPDDEETALKAEMDTNKRVYHESCQILKDTKSEIERIQRVFEAGKLRMRSDFESWLTNSMLRSRTALQQPSVTPPPMTSQPRKATLPPVTPDLMLSASGGLSGPIVPVAASTRPPVSLPVVQSLPGGLPSTGNSAADADIAAFYQAREAMLRRSGLK